MIIQIICKYLSNFNDEIFNSIIFNSNVMSTSLIIFF